LAHLARCAALILANPAAEMRFRLGAMETTFWPRVRAQRAFCAAEILARAAALILRGPCDTRVLFNPLSSLLKNSCFGSPHPLKPMLSSFPVSYYRLI